MDPEKLDKYLYIRRTPTWVIRSLYLFGILTWFLVLYAYILAAIYNPFYRYVLTPFILFFSIYQLLSFSFNLCYKQFNLKKHQEFIEEFWSNDQKEPSVDIFLPICGEDINVLRHTWDNVYRLEYINKCVYVLDDSKEECDTHAKIAEEYNFVYLERPNKGETKKAGNLKYGYEHSKGEFITIFDADFAPRRDFLKELLPYMSNEKIGIVQSPQYFEVTKEVHKRSPLEYGSAQVQECFYRFIEVVRDRFNGTVCCGTNAIYRRAALDDIGGPVQAGHSEDQRTGFAMQSSGWIVRYIPVILAVGLSPDDVYAYFHQQHRWCAGNIELMLRKEFWNASITWQTRLAYITGFVFYLYFPLSIVFSFQLFYSLFFYNSYITLGGSSLLFYPYLIFTVLFLFCLPIARFRWGSFYAPFVRMYSYSHADFASFFKMSVAWIPTNAKHTKISSAFQQTTILIAIYALIYLILLAFAVRDRLIHLFNYNYYTLQTWLFLNLSLSMLVLWNMYRRMETIQAQKNIAGDLPKSSFLKWQLKTAGLYILVVTSIFFAILYL